MKSTRQHTTLIIGVCSICWLLMVFIGYGYTHRPFLPEELLGVILVLWRSFCAAWILCLAGGIGRSIRFGEQNPSPVTQAVLDGALGLGVLSAFMLGISVTIGINFTLWIILIAVTLIFGREILLWLKSLQDTKYFWQQSNKTGRMAILLIVAILAFQYLEALAPPIHFDALTYHLAIPKAYLQAGRLTYISNNIFWGMPQLVEMLYTLAMFMGGTETAAILGWWIGLLALIGLTDLTKNIFEHEAAWTAAACLMAGSGLTAAISSGYVEWASILFGLAVLICFFQWDFEKKVQLLGMAGIFAGMALGTKYTNGVILLAGAGVLLLQKPEAFKNRINNILWFGGMATMAVLPWWIKNFFATSNPFYPLFIPSGAMDATLLTFYQFKPFVQDWSRIILLPWQATIWGVDGGEGFSTSIGPLLLGLAPLGFILSYKLNRIQKAAVNISVIMLTAGFFTWAIGSQFRGLLIQTRLYFVIFPAWALLAAAGYSAITKINSHAIRFGKLADAFILLALLFNSFYVIKSASLSNPMAVILNLESRESYLGRHLGAYEVAMQRIGSLTGNAQVLMLWETRGFECQPKCDPDEIIGRWYHDWSIYGDSNAIIAAWKELGYTHVLLNRGGADFVHRHDINAPGPEFWEGLQTTIKALIPVKEDMNGYELYKLP